MLKIKIAIVVSHPIQHFCPQYASFAKDDEIELKLFLSAWSSNWEVKPILVARMMKVKGNLSANYKKAKT